MHPVIKIDMCSEANANLAEYSRGNFALPQPKQPDESELEEKNAAKGDFHHDLKEKLVMIVEDDDDVRDALVAWVVASGGNSMAAANRDQALVMASKMIPHVILLDYWMPGMEIEPFMSAVRKMAPRPAVILMTAAENEPAIARTQGIEYFLPKPFDTNLLDQILQRSLGFAAFAGKTEQLSI
jgi:DNA-binding NtrC family response regulator